MERRRLLLSLLLLGFPVFTLAAHYGATMSYVVKGSEPDNLRGYQFMVNYDPQQFKWRQFNVYFDGGFSHFWDSTATHHSTVNVYSAAPVVRYTFKRRGPVLPFLELSIGLAYLNHTRIDNRNMGIHFAFQDRAGVGALFGKSERLSIGVHAVHYSNARLSSHNSGMTAPMVLDVGYLFS